MKDKNYMLAEVWGDVVDFKELLYSLAICTIGALGGYMIAPQEPPKPLIFGLVGVAIAFFVCAVLFKPKRHITEGEVEE
jgi:uncharacterized membrane protein YfcA